MPHRLHPTTTMFVQTRRDFVKLSLMAFPAASGLSILTQSASAESPAPSKGKPESRIAGVQLGLNVPYSFGAPNMSGEEILKNCLQLNISSVELRTQPVEAFLGVPAGLVGSNKPDAVKKLREWRSSVSMDRVAEFREKYETAGVSIGIVKVDGIFGMTDEELDYVFALAKALGARAISCEISHEAKDLKRVGSFADKHKFMVSYHGHATTKPEDWEKAFSYAKYNGANVDLGHFVAGNNISPVPFITQYHERISHVHLKDRKFHDGPNTPFGEGDTPIVEVLRLIRDSHWNIQGVVEFEYKVPAGSDRMTEIARAIDFCRKALT